MTFLAKRHDEWFLGHANEYISGVNLASPRIPRSESSRYRKSTHGVYFANFRDHDVITFYTEIRYKGAKVYPEQLEYRPKKLLVLCRLMGWDAYSAGYSNEQLAADGWVGVGSGDGATRWILVDELEKIEGPPPEGPF